MKTLVIEVEGGCVRGVYSDDPRPNLRILVADLDGARNGHEFKLHYEPILNMSAADLETQKLINRMDS